MRELLNIAQRQIAVAIDEQDRQVTDELKRLSADAAATGYLQSGRFIIERDPTCAQAIKSRAAFVWEILHRCVISARVPFSGELANELKAFARPYLANNVGALTLRANQGMEAMGLKAIPPTFSEAARDNSSKWLEAEIDVFCHALSQAPQVSEYKPQSVINIHDSTVGAVQTGDHSIAHASATTSNQNFHEARQALEELKREIEAAGSDVGSLLLVEACAAELAKPSPDSSRLMSLMASVKSCLSGIIDTPPKIPAAIDAVQRAISIMYVG